jgi:hypothetical protein
MASVAERLVLRGAAAAECDTRVLADESTVWIDDPHVAAHEQRTVRSWFDARGLRRQLLRPAVEASEVQRAGGAGEDGLGTASAFAASTFTHGLASGSKTCGRPRTQLRMWMQSFGAQCTSIASFA